MGVSTAQRKQEPTGKELVEWTETDFPGRTPGTRAAHSVGIGASGTFTPSSVMANFSTAPQFNSGVIDVLARFSNGSGLHREYDLHTDARGLAVKFFRGTDDEADMVAMTLPLFFVRNGADFQALSEVSVPVSVRKLRLRWWQKLLLSLQLKVPPEAPPGDVTTAIDPAHLTQFARDHPEAKSAVAALSGLVDPTSYGRATYHGVHAFRMTGPDGVERPVRYQWEPFLGVRSVTPEQKKTLPNDHLHRDLRQRLAGGSISFALQIMVGEEGDDPTDPTTPWPVQRTRITGGVLKLDEVVADQYDDQERVSYNPTRTVAGFVPYEDDLLIQARGRAYQYSCEQRGGSGCPVFHTS
jgi:catalase